MADEIKCAECGFPMVLRTSRYGKFWGCSQFPECKGTHGAHEDGRPLGIPADKETKLARIGAHEAFDRLWKSRKMTRTQAYSWMQEAMNLPKDEVHIGRFTKEQCIHLVALLKAKEEL
jgi:ssDNA-binding Zn-finger/Zn-ribbon topoisomerase 1